MLRKSPSPHWSELLTQICAIGYVATKTSGVQSMCSCATVHYIGRSEVISLYVRHYLLTFLDLLNSTVDDTDDVGVGLWGLHMTLCMCGAVTFSPIFDCWECLESET